MDPITIEALQALADLGTLPMLAYVGYSICRHLRSWQPTIRVVHVRDDDNQ